jgi:hypothetical protein
MKKVGGKKRKRKNPTRSGENMEEKKRKKEAVKCVLNLHYCHLELERYFVWFPDSQRGIEGWCV